MLSARSCSPAEMKIFCPGDRVGAVALRDRLGLDEPEVRAAMRLGQVHRAGPFAGGHFRQVAVLQFLAGMDHHRRDRAVGQSGVHGEGEICGGLVLAEQDGEEVGQALAAIFRIACDADPAALDQRLVGLLEAFRRGDAAVLVALAALDVADPIERLGDLLGEFRALGSAPLRRRRAAPRRSRAHWRSGRSRKRRSAGRRCRSPALCKSAWRSSGHPENCAARAYPPARATATVHI